MPEPTTTQVRLLTGLDSSELTDDAILEWLELNDQDPRLAAADALETYAGNLLDVASDDITLNGSRRAPTLLARAIKLRERAAELTEDGGFVFDIVDGTSRRPELTER